MYATPLKARSDEMNLTADNYFSAMAEYKIVSLPADAG
jgi:hypothetical protein